MYETLMEEAVTDEKCRQALRAVKRNQGAPGIDRMSTVQLEPHLEANWQILKDKLLKGTYIPTPVKRVEIPKPSGGTRTLGIPTVAS
jgi:retron-type reverse transcriptase